jgi:RHS repeat-associated protein
VKFNLRFPGQYYDEVTKQHYNHNRFYNPVLGRYVEPDRIGLQGRLNPYIYANENPITNVEQKRRAVERADQQPAWRVGITAHSLLGNWVNFNYI